MNTESGGVPKSDTAKREEEVLGFWRENKTFEKSVEMRPKDNAYVFYDGPPFLTGKIQASIVSAPMGRKDGESGTSTRLAVVPSN